MENMNGKVEYPFLDEHHLIARSAGGTDHPDNMVKVCPNCHRLLHFSLWQLTSKGKEWMGYPPEY